MVNVWAARERGASPAPDFNAQWLPEAVREIVRVSYVGTQPRLVIDGWVGSVRLKNGDLLQITSKFGESNFVRMLTRANDLSLYARDANASYASSADASPRRLIYLSFARSLEQLSLRGRKFDWCKKNVSSSTKLETIDLAQTALRVSMQKKDAFVGQRSIRTLETAEHRVLAYAASVTLSDNEIRSIASEAELRALSVWERRLRPTSYGSLMRDILLVEKRLRREHYSGGRGYYSPALKTALVVLGINGISSISEGIATGDAFLVNSDILFEKYVRSILSDTYVSRGLICDKPSRNEYSLFADGSIGLEPDILIRRGPTVVAVGDVKHKEPGPSDFHQVLTYAREFRVDSVFILQAVEDVSTDRVVEHTSKRDRISVKTVRLPILDLDKLESILVTLGDRLGENW